LKGFIEIWAIKKAAKATLNTPKIRNETLNMLFSRLSGTDVLKEKFKRMRYDYHLIKHE